MSAGDFRSQGQQGFCAGMGKKPALTRMPQIPSDLLNLANAAKREVASSQEAHVQAVDSEP